MYPLQKVIYSELCAVTIGPWEKNIVLESVLDSHSWTVQEMFVLLTDKVIQFEVNDFHWGLELQESIECDLHEDYYDRDEIQMQTDLLLELLRHRCKVN